MKIDRVRKPPEKKPILFNFSFKQRFAATRSKIFFYFSLEPCSDDLFEKNSRYLYAYVKNWLPNRLYWQVLKCYNLTVTARTWTSNEREQRALYDIEPNQFFPDFKTVLILVVRLTICSLKPESFYQNLLIKKEEDGCSFKTFRISVYTSDQFHKKKLSSLIDDHSVYRHTRGMTCNDDLLRVFVRSLRHD